MTLNFKGNFFKRSTGGGWDREQNQVRGIKTGNVTQHPSNTKHINHSQQAAPTQGDLLTTTTSDC